jgi:hypothetical protein
MHRRQARKVQMPYGVFDAHRFLQTALQSLHEALRRVGATASIEKSLYS